MDANMGLGDRLIRLLLAIIFATLFFTERVNGTWGIVLLTLAVIFTLTSVLSFCPLYSLFRINTCSSNK